jgi:hypothetical protein
MDRLHRCRRGRGRSRDRAGRRRLYCGCLDRRLGRTGVRDRSRSRWSNGRLLCRRRGRRRWRRRTGREQGHRIDVSLRVARRSHAEVDVRVGVLDHAARPDRSDPGPLSNRRAARDGDGAEMHEGQRVTRRRLDRNGLPARRDGAGEGDDSRSGCQHRTAGRRTEVDPSVLSSRVGVGAVERKRSEHRPVDRPRPGVRNRHRQHAGTDDHQNHCSPHDLLLVASFENEGFDGSKAGLPLSILATRYDGRARCGKDPSDERRPPPRVGARARRPPAPPLLRRRACSRAPSSRVRARG